MTSNAIQRALVVGAALLGVGVAAFAGPEAQDEAAAVDPRCADIAADDERLRCYDALAARPAPEPPRAPEPTEQSQGADAEPGPAAEPSYLSRLWELDEATRGKKFPITPFRSNYALPLSYNASVNEQPVQEADPTDELLDYEAKFQLSFKVKLWEDVLGRDVDLWVGYTQLSFWQVYDTADSSPFRETDYRPEILLNLRTDYPLLGLRGRFASLGFAHESNGRDEPLSRSWNRVVANLGFERGDFAFVLNGWYRVPEDADEDDNPNIEDYMGYGQLNLYYFWREHRFGLAARHNLRLEGGRGAAQAEWSFPLFKWVSGHVQYFYGYGESLIDYDALSHRIGVGFILKDW